jgi:hypothetical protein
VEHFLALTLAGRLPHHFHGETAHFRWHWLGGLGEAVAIVAIHPVIEGGKQRIVHQDVRIDRLILAPGSPGASGRVELS